MTKIDYELIAYTLFGEVFSEPGVLCEDWQYMEDQYTELVQALSKAFGQANQRFDRDKFLKACGLETS